MKDFWYTQHPENTYEHYYELARQQYKNDNPGYSKNAHLDNLKINAFRSDELADSIFGLGKEYQDLISYIAQKADQTLPSRGRDTHYNLSKFLDGKELAQDPQIDMAIHQLLGMVVPTIEREYAGSYCRPWYISSSRSLFREPLPYNNDTAWQWHSDSVPQMCFKLFFYLTDVDEASAPFTYLVDPKGNPVYRAADDWKYIGRTDEERKKINPPRTKGSSSRISSTEIKDLLDKGYSERPVCMPAGSFLVWSPNHIHKATYPTERTRDVLQIQLRCVRRRPESHWFGSNGREHLYNQFDWWAYD